MALIHSFLGVEQWWGTAFSGAVFYFGLTSLSVAWIPCSLFSSCSCECSSAQMFCWLWNKGVTFLQPGPGWSVPTATPAVLRARHPGSVFCSLKEGWTGDGSVLVQGLVSGPRSVVQPTYLEVCPISVEGKEYSLDFRTGQFPRFKMWLWGPFFLRRVSPSFLLRFYRFFFFASPQ